MTWAELAGDDEDRAAQAVVEVLRGIQRLRYPPVRLIHRGYDDLVAEGRLAG